MSLAKYKKKYTVKEVTTMKDEEDNTVAIFKLILSAFKLLNKS